jgi:hypothetical protein
MRSTDRPTYSVRFSWSCLAEILLAMSYTAEVYEPANNNRNAAYSQHPDRLLERSVMESAKAASQQIGGAC